MRALLYTALFLGTCTDDVCDPDLAVKELESVTWSLEQMTRDDQECFRRFAYREAEAHSVASVADEIRQLVDGLLPEDAE